jgi:anti-anti-sigma regulatory factor
MEPESDSRSTLLEVRRHGSVVVLRGEVDMTNSDLLRNELTNAAREGGDVVVDFAELTFIGSSGIHVLIDLATKLGERKLVFTGGGWGTYVVNLLGLTDRYPNIVVDQ